MRVLPLTLGLGAILLLAGCNKLQDIANNAGNNSTNAPASVQAADAVANAQTTDASKSDPLLENPQVGDLYAARISAFSGVSFSENGGEKVEQDVFGMLKVVDVTDDSIVVITETAGWDNPRGARNDLRGDHANITWDESERITLKRSELAGLLANGDIIETRRL